MRISYSAVSDYKACPTKYFLKKKWKNKKYPSAFGFGSAVERGIDKLLEGETLEEAYEAFKSDWTVKPANKWQGDFPIKGNLEVEYYKTDYDKRLMDTDDEEFINEIHAALENNEKVTKKDHKKYCDLMWESCSRKAYVMLKGFQEQILDSIVRTIAIQKDISIKNEDGDEARGSLDYIWEMKIEGYQRPIIAIVDCKTAGRPYTDHSIDASDQLRIYAAAEDIEHIVYVVLPKIMKYEAKCDACGHQRENSNLRNCVKCYNKKTKKGGKYTVYEPYVEVQLLHKELEIEDAEDVIEDFSEILTAMKNEVQWKNPDACYKFNKPCEFYEHCWKRKALEDIEHLEKKGR